MVNSTVIKFIRALTPIASTIPILAFCICTSPSYAQGQGGVNNAASETNATATGQTKTAKSEQSKSSKLWPAKATDGRTHTKTVAGDPLKSTADDRQSVEVTIYNSDMGLVKEQRNIKIEAGEKELRFVDVPSLINPVTVHIKPLSGAADFAVLEQNYEYDLISHAKLMDKYIGKTIKIMEWNQYQDRVNIVDAELLSSANGEVYKIDNEVYLGHPGVKVLPELPGNLISRPTLSWIYRSKTTCEQPLEVSYLTRGMNWNADYILAVSGDGKTGAGLSGWVTVNNNSGAEFVDAKLKLVAGEVNRVSSESDFSGRSKMRAAYSMVADERAFNQSEVFEYHIYDLGRPTTIKNNQTKQINLMEAQGVTVIKEYTTSSSGNYNRRGITNGDPIKQPTTAFLSFKNTKENKLGSPLPAGIIRIYTADAQGKQQFIGEDRVAHTPKDEEIRLKAGEVFDIVAERSQTDYKQKTAQMFETEWLISVRNRKDEEIKIGIIENANGTWQIVESTHKHTKIDATTFRFDVSVGKGQEVKVKYKIRIGM